MKKLFLGLATAMLLLISVLVARAISFPPATENITKPQVIAVNHQRVAQHLSQAIQFRTISAEPNLQLEHSQLKPQHEQFESFIQWLSVTYPEVHSQLQPERLGLYTLLFKWPGAQPKLAPVLLSGHYDVVPVIPGSEELWKYPPYSGHIDQTHIWGRGALDDKSAVIALMEATTLLLAEGFQPQRTVYLSLTHDEEIGGHQGTAAVVEKFINEKVRLAWSLDEGSFLLKDFVPGVVPPIASINVAEKGFLTLDLIARSEGGHSSMPPQETAVGILATALVKLQQSPLPGGLEGLSAEMFDTLTPYMPFGQRLLFANRWLFKSLINSALSEIPATNAMIRTSIAPTMLSASTKENVLAIEATGTVNFRLHPRDTVEGVVNNVRSIVNDPRVEVSIRHGKAASRESNPAAEGFKQIAHAAKSTYGQLIVTPGITIAGTDSRRYETIADDSYRFNPMMVSAADTTGFHGTNERISIENMANATRFYRSLIENGTRN